MENARNLIPDANHRKMVLSALCWIEFNNTTLTAAASQALHEYLHGTVKRHRGTIRINTPGTIAASFESGETTVLASLDLLRASSNDNIPSFNTQIRIGIHVGEIGRDEHSGVSLATAAAICHQAGYGEICISDPVYAQLKDRSGLCCSRLGQRKRELCGHKYQLYTVDNPVQDKHRYTFKQDETHPSKSYSLKTALVSSISIILMTWLGWQWLNPSPSSPNTFTVLVTPFECIEQQCPSTDFGSGFSQLLAAQLNSIPGVRVITKQGNTSSSVKIQGTIQDLDGHLAIYYRMDRTLDQTVLSEDRVQGDSEQLFNLEDRVLKDIRSALLSELGLASSGGSGDLAFEITAQDYYAQASAYLRRGLGPEGFNHAIRLLEQATNLDPDFALAFSGLCRSYWDLFEFTAEASLVTRAEGACLKALELDEELPETFTALGHLYRGTGRTEQAIRSFNKAIQLDDSNIAAHRGLAWTYQEIERNDEAERIFQNIIETHPGSWNAHMEMGAFLFDQGRYKQAIQSFGKVIQLVPDHAAAHSNLGASYYYLGKFEQAAMAYQNSVRIRPSSEAFNNSGTMFYHLNRFSQAAEMFSKAIELAPDDHQLWGSLADAVSRIPEKTDESERAYGRAITLLDQLLQIDPDDSFDLAYKAYYLSKIGNYQQARKILDRVFSRPVHSNQVWYLATVAWLSMDEVQQAQHALKKTKELGYPQHLIHTDPALGQLVVETLVK